MIFLCNEDKQWVVDPLAVLRYKATMVGDVEAELLFHKIMIPKFEYLKPRGKTSSKIMCAVTREAYDDWLNRNFDQVQQVAIPTYHEKKFDFNTVDKVFLNESDFICAFLGAVKMFGKRGGYRVSSMESEQFKMVYMDE